MAVVSLPDGQVAYTVRPDIWPLGSDILVEAGTLVELPACVEDSSHVRALTTKWEQEALAAGLADPGVAESHILAGHVYIRGHH